MSQEAVQPSAGDRREDQVASAGRSHRKVSRIWDQKHCPVCAKIGLEWISCAEFERRTRKDGHTVKRETAGVRIKNGAFLANTVGRLPWCDVCRGETPMGMGQRNPDMDSHPIPRIPSSSRGDDVKDERELPGAMTVLPDELLDLDPVALACELVTRIRRLRGMIHLRDKHEILAATLGDDAMCAEERDQAAKLQIQIDQERVFIRVARSLARKMVDDWAFEITHLLVAACGARREKRL